jgi:hypothetical protein
VLQLAPVCATLALLSPLLLSQAGSPHLEEARYIFQHVLSPQHYVPRDFWTEFVVFFAWCGLGALVGGRFLFGAASPQLCALWQSSLLLIVAATLLTTAVFISAVSQLYFWRLAPAAVLLAQIALSLGVVHLLSGQEVPPRNAYGGLRFLLGCALIWLTFRYHYGEFRSLQYGMLIALAVVTLAASVSTGVWRARSRAWTPAVLTPLWAVAALVPAWSVATRSSLISGLPQAEAQLYAWSASTPDTSVFLIPPQLENFRFNARRAVVVDFKSTPVSPEQLLEWYRRVCTVSGRDRVSGFAESVEGYAQLDSTALERIVRSYPFDYIVLPVGHPLQRATLYQPVYENAAYQVYRH